jgi:hypothetical protein
MDKHLLMKALLSMLICTSLSSMAAPQANVDPDSAALVRAQQKFAHALQITDRFSAQIQRGSATDENWRFAMIANLMRSSEPGFSQVESAPNYTDALSASAQLAMAGSSATTASLAKSLGDTTGDLVYVPINPCRIMDTRAVGTPIASATPTNVSYDAVNTGHLACSVSAAIPGGPFTPTAIAANVTVDETFITGFTPGSFLAVYPQGGTAGSSLLNFAPGQTVANSGVITINQSNGQFTILTNASAQVVIDVYGVFVPPQKSALDCTTVSNTSALSLLSPTTVTTQCAAGYTMVGGGCSSTTLLGAILGTGPSDAFQSGANNYTCDYNALGALGILGNGTAHATCCRTPGR